MDTTKQHREFLRGGEVTMEMAAEPALVWTLVADVTRVGEWSPECHTAQWVDGASGPEVGARFRGRNRWGLNRWSRICEVVESVPGRSFAFRTVPGRGPTADSTVWRYEIEPTDAGCRVTESYEITVPPRSWFEPFIRRTMPHHLDMRPHMERTLTAVRRGAEQPRES